MKQSNKITIYKYGDPLEGSISSSRKRLFSFGSKNFFFGGLLGLLLIFSPLLVSEFNYRLWRLQGKSVIVTESEEKSQTFGNLIERRNIKILKPKDTNFGLVIPKINLNSPVIAEIDPSNPDEYLPALKLGAAHAKGTYFPGEKGNIYIFAHSTDYIWNIPQFNAIFYLLKELEENDEINLFYQGKRYLYQVKNKKIVDPRETFYLKPQKNREVLILQTCWPLGTTFKRLLLFAELEKVEVEPLRGSTSEEIKT